MNKNTESQTQRSLLLRLLIFNPLLFRPKKSILPDTLLVEVTGFEPATSASRTQRSTKLSHTSFFKLKAPTPQLVRL